MEEQLTTLIAELKAKAYRDAAMQQKWSQLMVSINAILDQIPEITCQLKYLIKKRTQWPMNQEHQLQWRLLNGARGQKLVLFLHIINAIEGDTLPGTGAINTPLPETMQDALDALPKALDYFIDELRQKNHREENIYKSLQIILDKEANP